MYRVQAIMVMVMAAISLLGFFLVPARNSARSVGLEPASSARSSQACYSAEYVLNQKLRVRELLLSKPNTTFERHLPTKMTDDIAFVVEEENRLAWIVALGDLSATRFRRWNTLRIWKTGRIDEQSIDGQWSMLHQTNRAVHD
jgi:hypothetical protein